MSLSKAVCYWDNGGVNGTQKKHELGIRDDSTFDPILSNMTQEKTIFTVLREPYKGFFGGSAWQFDSKTHAVNGDFCKVYSKLSGAYVTEGYYCSTANVENPNPTDGPIVYETIPGRGLPAEGCYRMNSYVVARKVTCINHLPYKAVPYFMDEDPEFSESVSVVTASRETEWWDATFRNLSSITSIDFHSGIDFSKTNTIIQGNPISLTFSVDSNMVEVLRMHLYDETGALWRAFDVPIENPFDTSEPVLVTFDLSESDTSRAGRYSIVFSDALRPSIDYSFWGGRYVFGIAADDSIATQLRAVNLPGQEGGVYVTSAVKYYDEYLVAFTATCHGVRVGGSLQIIDGAPNNASSCLAALNSDLSLKWIAPNFSGYSSVSTNNYSSKASQRLAVDFVTGEIYWLAVPCLQDLSDPDRYISQIHRVNPINGAILPNTYAVLGLDSSQATFEGVSVITVDGVNTPGELHAWGRSSGDASLMIFDTTTWTGTVDTTRPIYTPGTSSCVIAAEEFVLAGIPRAFIVVVSDATNGRVRTNYRPYIMRMDTGALTTLSTVSWTPTWETVPVRSGGLYNIVGRTASIVDYYPNVLSSTGRTAITLPTANYELYTDSIGRVFLRNAVEGLGGRWNIQSGVFRTDGSGFYSSVDHVVPEASLVVLNNKCDQGMHTICCGSIIGKIADGVAGSGSLDGFLLINI